MEDFIVWIVVFVVLSVVVWIFNTVRKRRLMRKVPPEHELQRHVARLKEMRAGGAGYGEQMSYLLGERVDKKIAEILLAQVEKGAL